MGGIGINELPANDLQKQIIAFLIAKQEKKSNKFKGDLETLKLIPFKGTSMLPTLVEGDILVVAPITGTLPAPGDVILRAREKDTFVAHRVTGFDPARGMVFTRGDSLLVGDVGWNLRKNSGRVIGVWRNGVLIDLPPKPTLLRKAIVIGKLLFSKLIKRLGIL